MAPFYKKMYNRIPDSGSQRVKDLVTAQKETLGQSPRQLKADGNYNVSRLNSKFGRRAFCLAASSKWNTLPERIDYHRQGQLWKDAYDMLL